MGSDKQDSKDEEEKKKEEDPIEAAKRKAAYRAVEDHFRSDMTFVGIGSGSTIVYAVEAIQELKDPRIQNILFVPTGYQSRQVR